MKWLQLESNPEVFTQYARELGLHDNCEFIDVLSLEADVAEAIDERIANALAIVVVAALPLLDTLFPVTPTGENSDSGITILSPSSGCKFFKQNIDNACGTIALLHCLANLPSKHLATTQYISKIATAGEGEVAEESLSELHTKYASTGDSDKNADCNSHYIAIMPHNVSESIVLFDGRQEGPLLLSPEDTNLYSRKDFYKAALHCLQTRISSLGESHASDINHVALLALIPNKE